MELNKEQYERISECFPKQRKPAKIREPLIKTVLAKFLLAEVQIIVGIDWVLCALQSRKSRKFPEALLNQRFLSNLEVLNAVL